MQSQLFLKILLIYILFFIFDQTTHNMRENVFFISPVFLFISLSVLWFSRNLQAACNLYVCSKRPVNIFKYHQATHILYEKNRDLFFHFFCFPLYLSIQYFVFPLRTKTKLEIACSVLFVTYYF